MPEVRLAEQSIAHESCLHDRQWYAVYTTSRHEKRIAEHFAGREVESFLPLYRTLTRWKNGCKKLVHKPLFPNYLFVRITQHERTRVLGVPGVVTLVGCRRGGTALPEQLIHSLRSGLQSLQVEPHPYLVVGEFARIVRGPFEGMEGVVVRKKSNLRIVLTIDLIMKSVAVEVEAGDLEPVRTQRARLS